MECYRSVTNNNLSNVTRFRTEGDCLFWVYPWRQGCVAFRGQFETFEASFSKISARKPQWRNLPFPSIPGLRGTSASLLQKMAYYSYRIAHLKREIKNMERRYRLNLAKRERYLRFMKAIVDPVTQEVKVKQSILSHGYLYPALIPPASSLTFGIRRSPWLRNSFCSARHQSGSPRT